MASYMSIFLVFLSLVSIYTMYISSFNNGFFNLLSDTTAKKRLPGSPEDRLLQRYTGQAFLDKALEATVVFFWPICQGNMAALSLVGLCFSGGIVAVWVLIVIQTCRARSFPKAMAL
jgi:hypothetical protein